MEFSWGISLERRLQSTLEAAGISGSRERATTGIWCGIESKEDYNLPWNYGVVYVLRKFMGIINITASIK